MTDTFALELGDSRDTGRCECCGNFSRMVNGYAYRNGDAYAAYFVHWTLGHVPEHGANLDLIVGQWGKGAKRRNRIAVSLAYRLHGNGPGFMVIDATNREVGKNKLVGLALARDQVIGQPNAQDVFALCDTILAQDPRLTELLGNWTIGPLG
jgi:hypothetical protein